MASVSYPISPTWDHIDDALNLAFTCWFTAEMVIKLVGLGFRGYCRDSLNNFDAVVVLASLVEVILSYLPAVHSSE